MGISLLRAPILPRFWLSALALILVGWAGCKSGSHSVSSGLFIAPVTVQNSASVRVLANKIDFLQAINPELSPSVIAQFQADCVVLGRLSTHTSSQGLLDDGVAITDNLLVYEGVSRSLLSVNVCADTANGNCAHDVVLHYDSRGIDEDEGGLVGGVISRDVPPLQLKNGWILAYDSGSKNLIAFLREPERVVRDAQGNPIPGLKADFRPFVTKTNKNFGRGNGLLLSVVITGEEMATEIGRDKAPSEPIITRMVEIEENKVLLFFSTVREIHLLNLEERDATPDFDVNTLEPDHIPVKFLRGSLGAFKPPPDLPLPAEPYLPLTSIAKLTGDDDVKADTFQPILLPHPDPDPNPGRDFLLIFEQTTSTFLTLESNKTNVNGQEKILGGTARVAVNILRNLRQGNLTGPLDIPGAFIHKNGREVCFMEEKTNNLLAYDPTKPAQESLRIFIDSTGFSLRLDPSGTGGIVGQSEPRLVLATKDVNDNRLAFDAGLDELISMSYSSSVVVVVASLTKIISATGGSLVDITYLEPLDDRNLRAFDTQSNALLAIDLEYAAFPIHSK
jgi:hypothetical protein